MLSRRRPVMQALLTLLFIALAAPAGAQYAPIPGGYGGYGPYGGYGGNDPSAAAAQGAAQAAAMAQQAAQARARLEQVQAESTRMGAEFQRLTGEVRQNLQDQTGNDQRLTTILSLRSSLATYRNEMATTVGLAASASSAPPGMGASVNLPDLSALSAQLPRLDELLAQMDQFVQQYRQLDAAGEAAAAGLRKKLDGLREKGQRLRSDALNNPNRTQLPQELAAFISEIDAALAEGQRDQLAANAAVTGSAGSPSTPVATTGGTDGGFGPGAAEKVAAGAIQQMVDQLQGVRTSLQGHRESVQTFAKVRDGLAALEADGAELRKLLPTVTADCSAGGAEPLDPRDRVQRFQQEVQAQRAYLQERLALMDSQSPGHSVASDGLRRFVQMEQAFVEAAASGVPGRPDMDVFLKIRAEGGKLFAASNAAYKLVDPEAEPFVDVAQLRNESEQIDQKYRKLAWDYACSGTIDATQARAGLAELVSLREQFTAVAERLVQVLARPEDPALLVELARAWQTRGDIKAGLKSARRALNLDGEGVEPNYAYGQLLLADGAALAAQMPLEKAAARSPQTIKIYPTLADAYQVAGDPARGLGAAERGLQVDPANRALYDKAGQLHQALGQGNDIKVYVQGKTPAFDVKPQVVEGRTMVPFRAISEALGATVLWNAATREVVLRGQATEIRLPIGAPHAFVNGRQVTLDVPARVVDGRTLIPLRFLGEALGARVEWLPEWKVVAITHSLSR